MSAVAESVQPLSGCTMVKAIGRTAFVCALALISVVSNAVTVGSNPTRLSSPTIQVHEPAAMPAGREIPVERFSKDNEDPIQRVSGRLNSASTMAGMRKDT